MRFDLVGNRDNDNLFHYAGPIRRLIGSMRDEFLANGGKEENFTEYLEKAGIVCVGLSMYVSDELVTFAELKYGK